MEKVATKKKLFGQEYDPEYYQVTHFECDEPYKRPEVLNVDKMSHVQPWSGYDSKSDLPADLLKRLPSSTYNIKPSAKYHNAECGSNKWIERACDEALRSVQHGGGPFGTVVVQIDNATEKAFRYWIAWNHVTEWIDPTAHGEITGIRQACQELGVFNLGNIKSDDPNLKLKQPGKTSRVELYSSAEPCPMCYTGARWARIDWIYFAATVYDAAAQGVNFSDEPIYNELSLNYEHRVPFGSHCFQCETANSLDAFNHYKRGNTIKY